MTDAGDGLILLLGAGASAASGVPTFSGLIDLVVESGSLDGKALESVLARETDIFDVVVAGSRADSTIAGILKSLLAADTAPNPVHRAAASVLRSGGTVWTGNVDELIEIAAHRSGFSPHVITSEDRLGCSCERGHLVKPYGSVSAIARSYTRELPDAWHERLEQDADGRYMGVFGYSGEDPALTQGVERAIAASSALNWFTLESGVPALSRRYGKALATNTHRYTIVPDVDPIPPFLSWLAGYGVDPSPEFAGAFTLANPVDPADALVVRDRADRLVRLLQSDPELLRAVGWREFEEIVAALLHGKGYTVELTGGSRDHGIDIYASERNAHGADLLYLVQCKHYGEGHKVGAPEVQQLAGVVDARRATGGLLVTSSVFTRDAAAEAAMLRHRLSLQNHTSLLEWIRRYP